MNMITTQTLLAPEIKGLNVQTDQFKTQRISLSFVLPLTEKEASLASMLSKLLTRSTKKYPTPVALQRKLLSLYGARFSSGIIKVGDVQLLNFSITTIADGYALLQEPLVKEATNFLCDALFAPNLHDEAFMQEDFEICRRLLIESIESNINDKRKYAISQMYAKMCENEPFGIEIGGDIETANSITNQEAVTYWKKMLTTAPLVVTVVGNQPPEDIYQTIIDRFSHISRQPTPMQPIFEYRQPEQIREHVETMPIAQGKMVLGFRSTCSSLQKDNLALRIMCDIFGGAPYSKLFTVVREKMSLCYYCAARIQSQKGFLCVDCGVDSQNMQAARQGILDQLQAMQAGDFDDSVLQASLLSMADGVTSVTDSQSAIEAWFLARLFDQSVVSPEEFIQNLASITKQDVVSAAQSVVLDTVYILTGQEEDH